jgi:hypothetical protein
MKIQNENINEDQSVAEKHIRKWYTPIVNFAIHSLVGTVIFLIVALPALGLDWLVHFAETAGASAFVIAVLAQLEHAILVFDAVAVLLYIAISTIKEIKELLK